ncbi:hypothetical protein RND71_003506 [Anisodus tanguticus]|uniref:Uncharacterized protein n=1 Tax=Anisodus tanguticus TaxID=243964 RepID=A0AAE1SWS4_9SOLA|nr:hypothetical protein RND71_003506 [Anisodus tanguticus]
MWGRKKSRGGLGGGRQIGHIGFNNGYFSLKIGVEFFSDWTEFCCRWTDSDEESRRGLGLLVIGARLER